MTATDTAEIRALQAQNDSLRLQVNQLREDLNTYKRDANEAITKASEHKSPTWLVGLFSGFVGLVALGGNGLFGYINDVETRVSAQVERVGVLAEDGLDRVAKSAGSAKSTAQSEAKRVQTYVDQVKQDKREKMKVFSTRIDRIEEELGKRGKSIATLVEQTKSNDLHRIDSIRAIRDQEGINKDHNGRIVRALKLRDEMMATLQNLQIEIDRQLSKHESGIATNLAKVNTAAARADAAVAEIESQKRGLAEVRNTVMAYTHLLVTMVGNEVGLEIPPLNIPQTNIPAIATTQLGVRTNGDH